MNGYSGWNYTPYYPFDRKADGQNPYICRLAPYERTIELQWFDKGAPQAAHTLYYAVRGSSQWTAVPVESDELTLTGLQPETEYELYLERADGIRSNVRLARTGVVPGTIVNYLHPEDDQYAFVGRYLCSPAIARLPDGALIASMDVFHKDGPRNLSLVFRSEDDGAHWRYLTDLFPCFWGTPFVHRGRLYMLSVSNKYGDLLLGCSDDGGRTWGVPIVILRGACLATQKGFHRAPMPVISHNGRLWASMDFGGWESRVFHNTLVSVDEDADLMIPENWALAEPLAHNQNWPDADQIPGGLEGNAVVGPDGRIVSLLRYGDNKALKLQSSAADPHAQPVFDGIVAFPMGHTKFEVRRHPDGTYYAAGNTLPGRNVLALYTSSDLKGWRLHTIVVDYSHQSEKTTGFQYPAFMFNGEREILLLSRTAVNGADTFHNNNYVTFHRIKI